MFTPYLGPGDSGLSAIPRKSLLGGVFWARGEPLEPATPVTGSGENTGQDEDVGGALEARGSGLSVPGLAQRPLGYVYAPYKLSVYFHQK